MKPGYYWARYNAQRQITHGREWRIVEVVPGLVGAVLDDGASVRLSEFDKFIGPLQPPPSPDCTPCWVHPPVMRPEFHIDYSET